MPSCVVAKAVRINSSYVEGAVAVDGDKLVQHDEVFTSGDLSVDQAIDVSNLKVIFILADTAMAVNFHASGDPNFLSINLPANDPYIWRAGSGVANPFSQDVTSFDFSSSPGARRVQVVILVDT